MPKPLRIPLWSVDPQFDTDDPNYIPGNPGTYLLLALCYESLAGPSTRPDVGDIISPNLVAMKPRLAQAFGENPDGTWWVRLKKGLVSHWGNELTSESVQWGIWKAFAASEMAAWRWGQVVGIQDPQDVEPLDRYTLRYTMRRPNPNFPASLFYATPNVVDATEVNKHVTPNDPWGSRWLSRNVAGFGPFALVDFEEGRMVVRARKEYWAGEPPVGEIIVEKVGSRSEAIRMLDRSGPVFLAGLRHEEVRRLQRKSNVRLTAAWSGHTSVEIDYNTPPFDDIRVRHALSFATPYQEVIEKAYLGLARPWKSPISTFTAWYADQFWHYDADKAKARALMAEAGYAGGFKTQMYTPPDPVNLRIAEILKRAYGSIGVELELEDLGTAPAGWMPPLHLRAECAHNISEPLYDLAHDYAPFNPILPAPGGPGRVGTWQPRYAGNRKLEDMYRETLLAEDKDARQERCIALQKAIVEFAPCVFLAETPHFNASSDHAHQWTGDHDNRLVQVTLYQNNNSSYLSPYLSP